MVTIRKDMHPMWITLFRYLTNVRGNSFCRVLYSAWDGLLCEIIVKSGTFVHCISCNCIPVYCKYCSVKNKIRIYP